MRKLVVLSLTMLALIMSACGGSSGNKTLNVTYILGYTADPFYSSMACGAKAEAQQLKVNLNVQGGSTWGANVQTPILDAAVATHPDGIVLVPNDSKAMIAPAKSASDAGIKLALADTTLDDTSFVASSVSSDNHALGAAAADALVAQMGSQGAVLVVGDNPGVSTSHGRAVGFNDQISAKYPNITNLGEPSTSTAGDAGIVSSVTAEIAAHPNLTGILAVYAVASTDVATAIRQANAQDRIKVVGFDAEPSEIQQLQAGTVQALIGQKPYEEGQMAVQQVVDAIQGKATQKTIGVGAVTVTAQNLNDPDVQKYIYKTSC